MRKQQTTRVIRRSGHASGRLTALGSAAAALMLVAACQSAEDPVAAEQVSATVNIRMHDSVEGAKAANQLANLLNNGISNFTYQDITSIRIDIKDTATDTFILTNIQMEEVSGNWVMTIPYLPSGITLSFIARAYNVDDEEIFAGSTDVTFAGNSSFNTVDIELAPANDGDTYDMARIVSIQYPGTMVSGKSSNVVFAIEAFAGAEIDFELTAGGGDVPFFPAMGQITLYGITGQFVSIFTAPDVTSATDFTYEVTLTSLGNTSVKTSFTITVLPAPAGNGATDTDINILYNPVINQLIASRTPGTNDVTWEIVVSDNEDIANLTYQWTFTPGDVFTPDPTLTGSGQTNPVTMQDYSEPVHGTMAVSVTDSDGGVTTLYYNLVPEQFPLDPVDPGAVDGVVSIEAGLQHTCALFNDGAVRCWGRGEFGQLGYGNTFHIGDDEEPHTAGDVPLPAADPVLQISAGDHHTCALMDSGFVRCWGLNDFGQLGLGHTENVGDGEDITGPFGGIVNLGSQATKVSAGGTHTCALMDTGAVRCWGANTYGQLGLAHTNHVGDDEHVFMAGALDLGGTAVDITTGQWHSCALLDTGDVMCWGRSNGGQLGYGNTATIGDDESPVDAGTIDMGGPVIQIASSYRHTCAVLATGNLRCWGYGNNGQLGYGGIGHVGDNETPASVGDVPVGAQVTQVSAGTNHTCAQLGNSELKCWGNNGYGQLGQGNVGGILYTPPASGSDLDGNSPFMVTTGNTHTCALLNTGGAWCWGRSQYGQLGYAATGNIGSPPAGGDVQIEAP